MKKILFASAAALLLAATAQAQQTIAEWDFDNLASNPGFYLNSSNNPPPTTGSGATVTLGMNNDYNDGTVPSQAFADILLQGGASSGSSSYCWRIRGGSVAGGAGTPNGWSTNAPIGTQGASFSTSTAGYAAVHLTFDLFTTSAAEANVALLFTTNGGTSWTTNVPMTYSGSLTAVSQNNTSDPGTIMGPYLQLTKSGGGWYNQITVDLSGYGTVNNNPAFGFEVVNASTGDSCINQTAGIYNNSSGNWRFDNVIISGTLNGSQAAPPTITASATATVDHPFTNTFTPDDPTWRASITRIAFNGNTIPNTAYTLQPGKLIFTPSASGFLDKSGNASVIISANNYSADGYSQYIAPGAAKFMAISTTPAGPTANGGTIIIQPALTFYDQYTNVSTNCSATYTATASSGWSFGTNSSTVQPMVNGLVQFTNLSAISAGAVPNAVITLTASGATGLGGLGYTTTNCPAFNIPASIPGGFVPGYLAVEQEDLANNNSTFSMLELNPSKTNSTPVDTFAVPATYTNGLRQSSSGSTGRLSDSDDRTLLCFTGARCSDSSVSDATSVDPRGAGTFDYLGNYKLGAVYVGLGESTANQTRSAATYDDVTFWMGDKGGVYTNGENPATAYIGYTVQNEVNVRSLKSYNGTIYALQQEGGTDPDATVMAVVPPPSENAQFLFELEGFPIDGSVLDFYAVASGAHGTNVDVIYYIDGTNNSSGSIFKYTNSFTTDNVSGNQIWGSTGNNWLTPNGGDGLCVASNANGGFDLYYTTGKGGTTGNSVVHLYDSAAWNQPINITATNVLYTCSSLSTLKGIAFTPVPPAGSLPVLAFGTINNVVTGVGIGGMETLTFSFTSAAGFNTSFTGWSSTNVTLPSNQWKNLGHPTEGPAGTYSFTDPSATNGQTFYRVTSP